MAWPSPGSGVSPAADNAITGLEDARIALAWAGQRVSACEGRISSGRAEDSPDPGVAQSAGLTLSYLRLAQTALCVLPVARAAPCGVGALTASSSSGVHGLPGSAPPVPLALCASLMRWRDSSAGLRPRCALPDALADSGRAVLFCEIP